MAESSQVSRRDFLKASAAASTAALVSDIGARAFAQGTDTLKIGLVGCGGRGIGAAGNCVAADPGVKIWALGDLFKDKAEAALKSVKGLGAKAEVTPERCFSGFNNYKQVTDSGVDIVLLCTPPGFRPQHMKYAVEKGKHVFLEKPCATDPAGVRAILEASQAATERKLTVVAGTLYRHSPCYRETVKRIHDGMIGKITGGQVYYNTGELWHRGSDPAWSQAEYQLRNWYYFTWLSGDFNVEQHVHNLDVMHWVMGGPPVSCTSIGGRQKRTDERFGNIYDHFATDYEYPDGVHILSMCRQQNGTTPKNTNHYLGTKGRTDPSNWIRLFDQTDNKPTWAFQNPAPFDGYVLEHKAMIASIRGGEYRNEGKQQAESSLIGIMARMSAYSGKEVTWDFALNKSKLDLWPEEWKNGEQFGPMKAPPVPIPGTARLI